MVLTLDLHLRLRLLLLLLRLPVLRLRLVRRLLGMEATVAMDSIRIRCDVAGD